MPYPCVNVSRSLIQVRLGRLARREHHLPVLPVDHVAIVVDRDEVVVGPDFLELAERLQQRLVVPQPHVVDSLAIGRDALTRQLRVARQLPLDHIVHAERLPRRSDVVDDERLLLDLFVRRDDEPLQEAGIHTANGGRGRRIDSSSTDSAGVIVSEIPAICLDNRGAG